MSDKPSYLGLLNAVSNAESQAECYLDGVGRSRPPTPAFVRSSRRWRSARVSTARRSPSGCASSATRSCLVRIRSSTTRWTIASSKTLTDREKFEKLGLEREVDPTKPDIFSRFFDDTTIDIQTGALLGRYIAEERDSGRMLRGCYDQLCAAENGHATSSGNGDLGAQLSRIEDLLEKLVAKKR